MLTVKKRVDGIPIFNKYDRPLYHLPQKENAYSHNINGEDLFSTSNSVVILIDDEINYTDGKYLKLKESLNDSFEKINIYSTSPLSKKNFTVEDQYSIKSIITWINKSLWKDNESSSSTKNSLALSKNQKTNAKITPRQNRRPKYIGELNKPKESLIIRLYRRKYEVESQTQKAHQRKPKSVKSNTSIDSNLKSRKTNEAKKKKAKPSLLCIPIKPANRFNWTSKWHWIKKKDSSHIAAANITLDDISASPLDQEERFYHPVKSSLPTMTTTPSSSVIPPLNASGKELSNYYTKATNDDNEMDTPIAITLQGASPSTSSMALEEGRRSLKRSQKNLLDVPVSKKHRGEGERQSPLYNEKSKEEKVKSKMSLTSLIIPQASTLPSTTITTTTPSQDHSPSTATNTITSPTNEKSSSFGTGLWSSNSQKTFYVNTPTPLFFKHSNSVSSSLSSPYSSTSTLVSSPVENIFFMDEDNFNNKTTAQEENSMNSTKIQEELENLDRTMIHEEEEENIDQEKGEEEEKSRPTEEIFEEKEEIKVSNKEWEKIKENKTNLNIPPPSLPVPFPTTQTSTHAKSTKEDRKRMLKQRINMNMTFKMGTTNDLTSPVSGEKSIQGYGQDYNLTQEKMKANTTTTTTNNSPTSHHLIQQQPNQKFRTTELEEFKIRKSHQRSEALCLTSNELNTMISNVNKLLHQKLNQSTLTVQAECQESIKINNNRRSMASVMSTSSATSTTTFNRKSRSSCYKHHRHYSIYDGQSIDKESVYDYIDTKSLNKEQVHTTTKKEEDTMSMTSSTSSTQSTASRSRHRRSHAVCLSSSQISMIDASGGNSSSHKNSSHGSSNNNSQSHGHSPEIEKDSTISRSRSEAAAAAAAALSWKNKSKTQSVILPKSLKVKNIDRYSTSTILNQYRKEELIGGVKVIKEKMAKRNSEAIKIYNNAKVLNSMESYESIRTTTSMGSSTYTFATLNANSSLNDTPSSDLLTTTTLGQQQQPKVEAETPEPVYSKVIHTKESMSSLKSYSSKTSNTSSQRSPDRNSYSSSTSNIRPNISTNRLSRDIDLLRAMKMKKSRSVPRLNVSDDSSSTSSNARYSMDASSSYQSNSRYSLDFSSSPSKPRYSMEISSSNSYNGWNSPLSNYYSNYTNGSNGSSNINSNRNSYTGNTKENNSNIVYYSYGNSGSNNNTSSNSYNKVENRISLNYEILASKRSSYHRISNEPYQGWLNMASRNSLISNSSSSLSANNRWSSFYDSVSSSGSTYYCSGDEEVNPMANRSSMLVVNSKDKSMNNNNNNSRYQEVIPPPTPILSSI